MVYRSLLNLLSKTDMWVADQSFNQRMIWHYLRLCFKHLTKSIYFSTKLHVFMYLYFTLLLKCSQEDKKKAKTVKSCSW